MGLSEWVSIRRFLGVPLMKSFPPKRATTKRVYEEKRHARHQLQAQNGTTDGAGPPSADNTLAGMSSQQLIELEHRLKEMLLPGEASRPFLCDGSPLECSVAIVGINPATTTPFWPHWRSGVGFEKQSWLSAYQAGQANKRNQTRPRIELLVSQLQPLRCLELNLWPYSSRSEAVLEPRLRDTEVFNYLLSVVQPKLLFVFGNSPIKALTATFGVAALPKNQFTSCAYRGNSFQVFTTSHLSRGWSMQRVAELGQQLKARVQNAG